ncbi:hypothetical protein DTL42_23315 [Bremerella cremea]|uniref:Uncharacterized protein n=1 Tax=Bremerella cremea TaxID=1031537 RepID=A0A368KLB2_9BACT|nr:hypothetical protein [Bremerella cremea]RCS41484.1 hypothetical protein DTL42_23315 [Bremerella cremea]
MSSDNDNPFASPETSNLDLSHPDPDEDYPLVPTTRAVISEVPPPYRGAAGYGWAILARRVSQVLISIIGIGYGFIVMTMLPLSPWQQHWALAGLFVVFLLSMLESLLIGIVFRSDQQFWQARMIQQLKRRPDPLFRADQEPYQFVTLTSGAVEKPKPFRLTIGQPHTLDIGLLRAHMTQREVLLEGNLKRYRIPYGSLWNCELCELPLDTGNTWVIRLVLETDDGPLELHLCPADVIMRKSLFGPVLASTAEPLSAEIRRCLVPADKW